MKHTEKINHTELATELVLTTDGDGYDYATIILKGTFDFENGARARSAEEQLQPVFAGEFHGEPESSSYRLEPESTLPKRATDVVLLGSAQGGGATHVDVGIRVGPVSKAVRVFGDRLWYRSLGKTRISDPRPFDTLPLIYEHAYGGWDRSSEDEAKHGVEPRNPVGRGFRLKSSPVEEQMLLPNLEDPLNLIKRLKDRPDPAGFGFVAPGWEPRRSLAGTYDDAWTEQRAPLLPEDFDPAFLNAASPGLVAPGFLRGDEDVEIVGASPEGRMRFSLPARPSPSCRLVAHRCEDTYLRTRLDTLVIDAGARQAVLTWRCGVRVPRGHESVRALEVRWEAFDAAAGAALATG